MMEDSPEEQLLPSHLWCTYGSEKVSKILQIYCHDKEQTLLADAGGSYDDDFWEEAEEYLHRCTECLENYYKGRKMLLGKDEKYGIVRLPHKVKMEYVHFRSHAEYFLLPWKIPVETSRQSMLFQN